MQVLELFIRRSRGERTTFVHGLSKSMTSFRVAPKGWARVKDKGVELFSPERGGSYAVFEKRPLDPLLLDYCSQDVGLMLVLEAAMQRYAPESNDFVFRESAARVALSQTSTYNGKGRHMALASVTW